MEHPYKAPNNFQDQKRRPRRKWRTYTRRLWRMVMHCLSSVRQVRYPSVARWRGPLVEARANEMAQQEANQLMDEFIDVAAHEIRTPLTTIKASVQLANRQLSRLAQRKTELPDDLADLTGRACSLLDRAQRQIETQNRLVGDMLDVSRIRTGHLEMRPERCNIVTTVAKAVEDQRCLVPERTIICTLPPEEIFVMADVDRVKQVVTHYLSNALKYSAKDKPVGVYVKAEGNIVQVQVCDEGPGLPEIERRRVWERFYRAEGIEVSFGSGVGLGLGLHISQTLIEMQGGQVGVDSIPGQGSAFWFTLPEACMEHSDSII